MQVNAHRHGAVIRMRPGGNILMPLEPAAALARLHVELGMVKLDISADNVRHQIHHDVGPNEIPDDRKMVLWARDTMQPRRFGAMTLVERVDAVRLSDLAAAFDQIICGSNKLCEPFGRHIVGQDQVAVAKVAQTLLVSQHVKRVSHHIFWFHLCLLCWPVQSWSTYGVRDRIGGSELPEKRYFLTCLVSKNESIDTRVAGMHAAADRPSPGGKRRDGLFSAPYVQSSFGIEKSMPGSSSLRMTRTMGRGSSLSQMKL